jgi:hypothetical protein
MNLRPDNFVVKLEERITFLEKKLFELTTAFKKNQFITNDPNNPLETRIKNIEKTIKDTNEQEFNDETISYQSLIQNEAPGFTLESDAFREDGSRLCGTCLLLKSGVTESAATTTIVASSNNPNYSGMLTIGTKSLEFFIYPTELNSVTKTLKFSIDSEGKGHLYADNISDLTNRVTALESGHTTLNETLQTINEPNQSDPVDLSEIETRLYDVEDRLDELNTSPSNPDSSTNTVDLTPIETRLEIVEKKFGDIRYNENNNQERHDYRIDEGIEIQTFMYIQIELNV